MAEAAAALRAMLLASAPLNAAVSGGRIYPASDFPLDSPLPALSYSLISKTRTRGAGTDPNLYAAWFQVDCAASSYPACKELAAKVADAVQRKSGTYAGLVVNDSWVENEQDGLALDAQSRWVSVDIILHYRGPEA